ncbi:TonB-dependent receptor plug domain-containing protein [Aquimarina spongiae]|uniref:Hemoglobin/transferrin/lactoferrin receptor protein n=1 Tax=Aquimarina spongiae TaxID=570521 RepID=A0A1M6JIP8_9FLAO|nr:TonB-dependent receptor [Aquimarina spongiae]SHJ46544.1 hemoglobin/transferrin/lactoferrin receptor protein [Aquimarina spongiae]
MRLILTILLFFILAPFVNAQQISVLSKASKTPIPNVAIYNKDKSKSALTDFDGVADISSFADRELLFFDHVSHVNVHLRKSEVVRKGNKVYMVVDENQLSEVVISVSKWEQDKDDITHKVLSITSEDISQSTPQTSADLLQNSGQVFVQKSQLGGGSPIIRGFSTNRLLITVDGVRMNTAIFRGGNVQNVISIDPFTIGRTEVILGPGSVVYGSDAIGGVMNFYTEKPKFSVTGEHVITGNVLARYASASNEKTGHIDLNIGLNKWAFLTSVSYTDFDDLRMGSNGPDDYLRTDFVERINGQDVVLQNPDPEEQVFTGYDQVNFLQKIHFTPNETWDFNADLIYTTSSDYPRYDRLIRRRDGNLQSAEWFYGPQRWFMGNLQVAQKSRSKLYDKMKITAAYQFFEESRNDRNFGSTILERTQEQVDVYSLNVDFEKKYSSKTSFYYGLEYILNNVFSDGSRRDIETGVVENAPSRYPDGSTWQSIAAYLSIQNNFSEKLRFQGGLRYNRIILFSQYDDEFFDFPFDEANLDTDALTGTAGLSWLPNDILHWKLNFSTAFRAPNIDDVGKIFDSEPGSVVVPNPDLRPEYAYNGELGLSAKFGNHFTLDLATYYTYLDNALVRSDFNLNGETEILFGGELSNVQAIQNAARARIYGFEAGLKYNFAKNFEFASQYTFVGGEEELEGGLITPSRHVSPQFGNSSLTFRNDKLMLSTFVQYNGTFDFEDLAPSQQNNPSLYASDENGNPYSPSWYTLNFRSQYNVTKNITGIFSVENITDQRYRPYSSGIAGAGRNFIASLKYSF